MSSDNTNIKSVNVNETPQQVTIPLPDAPGSWNGMTMDELRRARARALVRREVGRTAMQYDIAGVRTNVANNGVRALLFKPGTVSSLKVVDYVVMGFRITRWLMELRGRRRRR